MLVDIERQNDVCVLRFKGRFQTGADFEYLRTKADEIKSLNCCKILADFETVPYIDSTGIGFIVAVYSSVTKSSGGRFILAGVGKRVREVLDLTRLSSVIPSVTDVESGLAELSGAGEVASSSQS